MAGLAVAAAAANDQEQTVGADAAAAPVGVCDAEDVTGVDDAESVESAEVTDAAVASTVGSHVGVGPVDDEATDGAAHVLVQCCLNLALHSGAWARGGGGN